MSAHTWKVQANAKNHLFGWKTVLDRLPLGAAEDIAKRHASINRDWFVRLVDDSTGEIRHIEREAA